MAGDWIPRQKGLNRKPEVLAIAQATGMHRRWVADALMEFWEWCDAELTDGLIRGLSLDNLPSLVPETTKEFWQAVAEVGWLRVTTSGLAVPHFERWLGRSAKKRIQNSERKRSVRDLSSSEEDKNGNPVLFCPVLSSEFNSQNGGRDPPSDLSASEADKNGTEYAKSAGGCAAAWCFVLTRKRNGYPADREDDIASEIAEMVRRGHDPGELLADVMRSDRDKGEHFWQFKERHERNRNGGTGRPVGPSSRVRAEAGKYDGYGVTVGNGKTAGDHSRNGAADSSGRNGAHSQEPGQDR